MQLCLIHHHLDHHFHLVACLWHLLSCQFLHILHCQLRVGLKDLECLLLAEFWLLWLLLGELSLLSSHYEFGCLGILCKQLVCHAELLLGDVENIDDYF